MNKKINHGKNETILDTIRNRRSVRYFKPDPVSKELIEKVIEAGNWAPSAGNLQPWRFVILEDEQVKNRLKKDVIPKWRSVIKTFKKNEPARYNIYKEHIGRKDPVFYSAPVIIFIIGPSSINGALACQNMMLAAHAIGLGSCYVGWGALILDDLKLIDILELKNGERIIGPIVMGFPEKIPETPSKKEAKVKWV